MQEMPDLVFSVSATTRPPRAHEQEGVHYHFMSESEFQKQVGENRFLEWARVHGAYYGTPRDFVETRLSRGENLLLDIDVQGGLQVKEKFPEGVFIFVAAPSFEELRRRLKIRGTEDPEEVEARLREAREELRHLEAYQYVIVNEELSAAVEDLKAILRAEQCRLSRRLREIQDALSPH